MVGKEVSKSALFWSVTSDDWESMRGRRLMHLGEGIRHPRRPKFKLVTLQGCIRIILYSIINEWMYCLVDSTWISVYLGQFHSGFCFGSERFTLLSTYWRFVYSNTWTSWLVVGLFVNFTLIFQEMYELLAILDFNNERKRMSVSSLAKTIHHWSRQLHGDALKNSPVQELE